MQNLSKVIENRLSGCLRTKQAKGGITKRQKEALGITDIFITLIAGMAFQCKHLPKTYQIVYFKYVLFTICQNKVN